MRGASRFPPWLTWGAAEGGVTLWTSPCHAARLRHVARLPKNCARARSTGAKSDSFTSSTGSSSRAAKARSLYDLPHLYDKVFGWRDYEAESDFIARVVEGGNEGGSAGPRSVLDLGCGTGRHCLALAEKGYSVTGLDSSASMLDYARRVIEESTRAGAGPLDVDFVRQDLTDFSLGRTFSAVTLLLGTLSHVHSNEDVVRCFTCARDHLDKGGALVLELAHPSQLFSLPLELGTEAWDVKADSEADGEEEEDIVVQYGSEDDAFDPVTQILTRTVTVKHPKKRKRLPGRRKARVLEDLPLEEEVEQRFFTCQEIRLLAELSGLKVARMYGDMAETCVLGTEEDEEFRMVAVLKRTDD